jgi:hypothetical protein
VFTSLFVILQIPFLQCDESESYTVKYQYETRHPMLSDALGVESVRDTITGARATAFRRGMQTTYLHGCPT